MHSYIDISLEASQHGNYLVEESSYCSVVEIQSVLQCRHSRAFLRNHAPICKVPLALYILFSHGAVYLQVAAVVHIFPPCQIPHLGRDCEAWA
jgi:hypothetical protein